MKSRGRSASPQPAATAQRGLADAVRGALEAASTVHRQGDLLRAAAMYRAVLDDDPDNPEALHLLGVIASQQGDHGGAADLMRRAIRGNPRAPEFHTSLGLVLRRLEQPGEAEASYREALRLNPAFADAHFKLGNLLRQEKRTQEAGDCYEAALRFDPGLAEAALNLGNIHRARGELERAESWYREALARRPDYAEARANVGVVARALGRLEEAVAHYHQAIAQAPVLAETHCNLANALQELDRNDEAIASYREAIRLQPAYVEAHVNLGLALIAAGCVEEGWSEYGWRFRLQDPDPTPVIRMFPQPEWRGEPLAGKRILVWPEQGIGDQLHYAGLYPELITAAAGCVLESAPKLVPLFARCFPGATVVPSTDPPHPATRERFDFQAPAADLARWLRPSLASFPARRAYLSAHPARLARWRARLAALGPGLKIGFSWRSSNIQGTRALACTVLEQWGPIFAVPGVHFVCLQYDECAAELEAARVRHAVALHAFPEVDLFNDLEEAAALTAAVDLVVSAPTSVSILSAALGITTWQMTYGLDWQTHGTERNPWYPAMRQFRRAWNQDWAATIEGVAAELKLLCRSGNSTRQAKSANARTRGRIDKAASDTAGNARRALAAGLKFQRAGDHARAEAEYRKAARLDPELAEAHANLGSVLNGLGRHDEALEAYQAALRIKPDYPEAHNNLANLLLARNRVDEAIGHYQAALRLRPSYPAAQVNLGLAYQQQGKLEQASACFRTVLRNQSDYVPARMSLGVALKAGGDLEGAADCFRAVVRGEPGNAEAHSNLGIVLQQLGQLDEAVTCHRAAARLQPARAEIWSNLGVALKAGGDLDQAIASLREAVRLDPGYEEGWINLGAALLDRGIYAEALECYQDATRRLPARAETHWNLALALLLAGELEHGWREYEWRFRRDGPELVPAMRRHALPEWRGEPVAGKRILVWGEQGIGDELHFAGLYPELIAAAAGCVLESAPKLVPLFARCFPGATVVPSTDPPHPATRERFDFQAPAADLARWLRPSLASFPARRAYLSADPARLARWRARLAALGPGLKIGFSWRSSNIQGTRALACTVLEQWGPIFAVPGVHFVCLQYDECAAELEAARVRHAVALHAFPEVDLFNDLEEAAALTAAVDLVVSAPTSVSILSAALGITTWQMTYGPDWQTHGTERNPWYPAMRQFRRAWNQDWAEVIALIAAALRRHVEGNYPTVLAADPANAHYNLALALENAGKLAEATAACREAVRLKPDWAEAWFRLGTLLQDGRAWEEAARCYREVLRARPGYAQAHSNLGTALVQLGLVHEAEHSFRAALACDPGYLDAHWNLALALQLQGDWPGAAASFRALLSLDPGHVDAHRNLALTLLRTGEFDEGWREYEWRWRNARAGARRYAFTPWDGRTTPPRRLLVWGEQGIGDEILYASIVPDLIASGMEVSLEVDPRLAALFQRSFPQCAVHARSPQPVLAAAEYDYQASLAELGRHLRRCFDDFPSRASYLVPDPRRVAECRALLRERCGPAARFVGISWHSANEDFGPLKSVPLSDWAPVLGCPGIRFVDLQYGDTSAERKALQRDTGLSLERLAGIDLFQDVEGLAALCACCDLVITVSNVTAHVAGALGRPVWLLAPATTGKHWYWFTGRDDSPWYPSMRLFRQPRPGNWDEVIVAVRRALQDAPFDSARDAEETQRTDPHDPGTVEPPAVRASQDGDHAAAEERARRAIASDPRRAEFHVSFGYALRSQGRLTEAEESYREAIRLNPRLADAHHRLAHVLRARGRLDAAADSLATARSLDPGDAAIHVSTGNLLHSRDRLDEAAQCYRAAIEADRGHAVAHRNLAVTLQALGRHEEAIPAFEAALRLGPDAPDLHSSLAGSLAAAGRHDEAITHYRTALRAAPDDAQAQVGLGIAYLGRGDVDPAIAAFREALRSNPPLAVAHSNLGIALLSKGLVDEAVACQREAARLGPGQPAILSNLGAALSHYGRPDEAEAHCREALQLDPGHADAWIHLGAALEAQGRHAEALASAKEAVRHRPDSADAHWNLALALLVRGDYEHGWAEYEWRWDTSAARRAKVTTPCYARPRWRGESLAGRTLFVPVEQGHGDAIQFVRYAAPLAQQGARVVLECPRSLARLLARAPGIAQVVESGPPPPDFDFYCPLLSLPYASGTTLDTVPAGQRYLSAEPAAAAAWRARVQAAGGGPRIGIAWAGRAQHENDRNRSMALAEFAPLARAAAATWFSLQKGAAAHEAAAPPAGMRITDWSTDLHDFADTAALIENLDLVITVDTAVAHLAAALGKPTWILLPYLPDWRWLLGREDSPWYPSARLFRQSRHRDWQAPLAQAALALEQLSRGTPTERPDTPAARLRAGIESHRAGDLPRAAELYDQLLSGFPDHPDALHLSGVIECQRGNYLEARARVERALKARPDAAEYHNSLGNVWRGLGRIDAAIASYREAQRLNPRYAEAHQNLGIALKESGAVDAAISSYRTALDLKPDYPEAHVNLGNALQMRGRFREAEASYHRALGLRPDYPEACMNLGNALQRQGALGDAETWTRKALRLRPDYADAYLNLGQLLEGMRRGDEALAAYGDALRISAQHPEARWNRALALLHAGKLDEGWREYAWRFRLKAPELAPKPRAFPHVEWRGEPVAGKRILVWGEQGIGDELHFAGLYPELIAAAAGCVLESAPKLVPLFARCFPGATVVPSTDPPHPATRERFDFQAPAADLARWLRPSLASFPARRAYLSADPARLARWRARLAALGPGLKIGFSWRSSNIQGTRALACTVLEQWGPIFAVPGVHFVCLQYDECAAELEAARVRHAVALHAFPEVDLFNDLEEAAALTAAVDLVVSAPTSVSILSAALGITTWQMTYGPDWQTHGTERNPWYPAMRQFRRAWNQDWAEILAAVATELAGVAAESAAGNGGALGPADSPNRAAAVRQALNAGLRDHATGDFERAEAHYREALAADPRCAKALHLLGISHRRRGETDKALDLISQAIALDPRGAEFHASLGNVHRDRNRLADAVACYERALALNPTYAEAHFNLATTRGRLGEHAAAEAGYRAAVRHNPQFGEAWYNLGKTVQDRFAWAAAAECYREALRCNPGHTAARSNLGTVLIELGRTNEAEHCFRETVSREPGYAAAHKNLALVLLARGEFTEGWREHQWRFWQEEPGLPFSTRPFSSPEWRGEPLAGKRILVWPEQGIGDGIQFAGLYPELVAAAGHCVFECIAKLVPLFARCFPGATVVPSTDPPHPATRERFDFQAPAADLARWLRPSLASFPARRAYLSADPARLARWRARLAALGPGLKIGFSWRSSNIQGTRALACTVLEQWGPIFAVPGVHFVCLQYDECAAELEAARVRHAVALHAFPEVDLFNDLEEAAALTAAVDLVVSAPTSVSILSAALGITTWQMTYGPDWQTHGTERNPWYPAMRQFRRAWNQDWAEIIAAIGAELVGL